ncbi:MULTISPECIES: dihydroxyacetone kinase subunit DhaL [unclassified Arthrobacter]|uniref:dihydroxyacetone kinase subunit DhaL n=1 Tax=unclassified Arthrobacter TaxID=235627 RepID=UPI00159D6396|nr:MULTISPECIES: dihydroxyacetone kinase subunit DhaL [unclassified Arthrobacter]MCQ9162593.1 dihydroxyacetone kinase subunit L [Arthrobacter sp. STN4]NVM97424.1 dihydroxyacetone kinase subunit L [Arthrobacter sp. SDTb3-6]
MADNGTAGTLDVAWAIDWLRRSAAVVAENRVALIELDRAIGDGDHGENLDRGFTAILAKLDEELPATPGAAFKLAALTLMSKVGGAAGPLYGTAFLRAGTAVGDAAVLDSALLVAALTAARDGVVARGKAELGDKTMIDAWTPAVDAAAAAADMGGAAGGPFAGAGGPGGAADGGAGSGSDGAFGADVGGPAAVLAAAAEAAEAGAAATDPLIAHKGRASYLGERAIGHRDPGAASSALILRAAADAAAAASPAASEAGA